MRKISLQTIVTVGSCHTREFRTSKFCSVGKCVAYTGVFSGRLNRPIKRTFKILHSEGRFIFLLLLLVLKGQDLNLMNSVVQVF